MAVVSLGRPESIEPGVYPFDPRKHLRQVADLVGAVFADEIDAEGRNMLREMQMIGWLSPILGGLMTPAFLGDAAAGYVWAEGGRVLGNVTLQRVDYGGTRWRISNVAVAPEHRGQGIAKALMQSSLSEIAQQGGSWAVLQVRADNPLARRLYDSLGFTAVCLDGIWKLASLPKTPEPDPSIPLCPLPARAWRDRFELAQAAQTQLANWASPVERFQYEVDLLRRAGEAIGNLTGLYRVQRWGLRTNDLLEGAVETVAGTTGEMHKLRLAVRPEARGRVEKTLVDQGLRTLIGSPPAPVIAEHSGDHVEAVAALEAAGFRPRRVLLTMRRQIIPADALL